MTKIIKVILYLIVWPFGYLFSGRFSKWVTILKWKIVALFISHRFKKVSNLRLFGIPLNIAGGQYIELGDGVVLAKDCRLEAIDEWRGERLSPRMVLGNNVILNPLCHIGCINEISIGDHTTIAQRTYITDHLHGESVYEQMQLPPRHRPLYSKGKVVIGECVSIGENCAILPGVTIGSHSIIGANSVVTKDVPPYSIVAGVPAKVLKIIEPV